MTPAIAGALLVLAGGLLVLLSGQGTRSGALAGVCVAMLIVLGLGVRAFAPLAVFVLGSGALTRLGRVAKEERGVAEARGGRRGVPHVLAKLGLPALLGAMGLLHAADPQRLELAYAAALAGAFADTASTEIGPLGRGAAFALRGLSLRRLPHGTPGAVSAAGLLGGAGAAAACGAAALAAGVLPTPSAAIAVSAFGLAASVAESVLAPTPLGVRLGHHGRNAVVSILSAGLALSADGLGCIAR